MSCTFWGKRGVFFGQNHDFFQKCPNNSILVEKMRKSDVFLDTSTVEGIEWCIFWQNFFCKFFEIFDVFLRNFLSNFRKVNVPVVSRHFYWSQKMIVVAELVYWSRERGNFIFDFSRNFPPKTDFFTFFSVFFKKSLFF